MIYSNIVKKDKLREVQLATLEVIKDALLCSFGPMGSNTASKKENALTKYTKDGHTILGTLMFKGPIEFSVKEDLEELTRYIVKTVGDGTTSAIILSALIFKGIVDMESKVAPFVIIEDFKKSVAKIVEKINAAKKIATVDDIYKIAMISTNGNEEVSANLKTIYEDYGMEVFIDVNISNTADSLLKVYDGMTLEAGYADNCFINDKAKGVSNIRNPKVYVFEDPIDTPEMISLFDAIIANNILKPYNTNKPETIVPTVILTTKLSRDMSTYMDKLAEHMYSIEDYKERPPFLLVSNIYHHAEFLDIAKLCGAKIIKKYLDPKIQAIDIAAGAAPIPTTVAAFGGSCEMVEADINKTKFINPLRMKNEDGSNSIIFNSMVEFLEAELKNAVTEGEDSTVIGGLKRRINSLKANMVEYLVGGVAMSDRDSLRDLVEDAVLNCRSAAKDGFGHGANFEGFIASCKVMAHNGSDIDKIINKAYFDLSALLYNTYTNDIKKAEQLVCDSNNDYDCPFNLRTGYFDGEVLTSINSDIVVLETISKIVTLMFTCNQFICPTPLHNVYMTVG